MTGTGTLTDTGRTAGRLYEVRHRTAYTYDEEVTASYGRAYVTPRDAPGQTCRSTTVEVEPTPLALTGHEDHYGNRTTYLEVHTPHTVLDVTAVSLVEVTRTVPDLSSVDDWTWQQAADAARDWPDGGPGDPFDLVAVRSFALSSPLVALGPEVRAWSAGVFAPGRPVGQAVTDLVHRIHAEFEYNPKATSVRTTLPQVLARRAGVCQDFAHLAVGALRCAGLPARYVSGYLETQPPPGKPRLQGADASHAWASVLLPELGWVDLDPTNDQLVDDRYVVTAWGRDYTDVPPVKGVIFTEGAHSTLTVEVDVIRR